MRLIYRQGDVLLTKVAVLPKTLKPKKDNIVAYGEVTGHSHRFSSTDQIVYQTLAGQLFAKVKKQTSLIHEEHNTLEIDPGIYKVGAEREFDYFENELRGVVD